MNLTKWWRELRKIKWIRSRRWFCLPCSLLMSWSLPTLCCAANQKRRKSLGCGSKRISFLHLILFKGDSIVSKWETLKIKKLISSKKIVRRFLNLLATIYSQNVKCMGPLCTKCANSVLGLELFFTPLNSYVVKIDIILYTYKTILTVLFTFSIFSKTILKTIINYFIRMILLINIKVYHNFE